MHNLVRTFFVEYGDEGEWALSMVISIQKGGTTTEKLCLMRHG